VRFTSANSRNQLRERQRRDRATAQVMRAMYPQFASLKLEFDFSEPDPDAARALTPLDHASAVPGVFRISVSLRRL